MSGRRAANNRIRGPQSALTDFLASNNISAAQISAEYQRRQDEARQREEEEARARGDANIDEDKENDEDDELELEAMAKKKKKKREQEKSLAKIKASKKLKAQKKRKSDDSDEESDGDAVWDMYKKKQPVPGQLENCEMCEKRFTVTPYSKTGPNGGLLCVKCSKEQEAGRKKEENSKKQAISRDKRRKVQSNLLDGIVQVGSKSLQELCIKEVAKNIHEVEEFGDIPANLLKRLSQILSKRRILTSRTLDLFLRSDLETIDIYDCGKLETEDYIKMLSVMPKLRNLNLRNAGQFKDEVLDYVMERNVPLRQLRLDGANLVSSEKWVEFFAHSGDQLETLQISWLDNSMGDDTVQLLVRHCPNLTRLKMRKCFKVGDGSLAALSNLRNLQHLSLEFNQPTSAEALSQLIVSLGSGLRTLSLRNFNDANDSVLDAIHLHCTRLSKLRFTDNDVCTDAGFVSLFTNWSNPSLSFVDLSSNRSLDYETPDGPADNPVGLASAGLQALVQHSGPSLEHLDISSCRHISRETFSIIFTGTKINKPHFPLLKDVNFSFLTKIDTPIVAGLFKSSPSLNKVIAFGCFNVTDVKVPLGVALIGLPNAQESIVQDGGGAMDIFV